MLNRKARPSRQPWDARYEWQAVLLLMLGFDLLGMDRFSINALCPAMSVDLGLTYADLEMPQL